MSYIVPDPIEKYAEEHTSPISVLLERLEQETAEKTDSPQMLCGRVEGRFLQMLIKITGSKKVVEIGTFTGYSALLMAEALPEIGELITCELATNNAEIAQRYFDMSPYGGKIQLKVGPALETLKKVTDNSIDLVFIDADKASYTLYYEESIRIIRSGGIIAADNALWSGRVLDPEDDESRAISSFNKTVKEDERVDKVLLTVRDGIYLIRKK